MEGEGSIYPTGSWARVHCTQMHPAPPPKPIRNAPIALCCGGCCWSKQRRCRNPTRARSYGRRVKNARVAWSNSSMISPKTGAW